MVLILVMIFLGCSAAAEESEKCDRVRFSSDDPKALINSENFTKQSFEINGKPVYYSCAGLKDLWRYTRILWNKKINTWSSQTMLDGSDYITKTKIKISSQTFFYVFLND